MPEPRGGYPFPNKLANDFAQRFAAYRGEHYGCYVANGTIALMAALQAAGLPDDFPPAVVCNCKVAQAIVFRGLPASRQRRRQKAIVCATAAWPGAC